MMRFVSTFIGEANVFTRRRVNGWLTPKVDARVSLPGADGPVTVVVRPEALRLSPDVLSADTLLDGTLADVIYRGAFVNYMVALSTGQRVSVHNSVATLRRSLSLAQPVKIGWLARDQRVIVD
jgi:ABC-type Fe3+/spermidine/putrescine transport system ATPase subunit